MQVFAFCKKAHPGIKSPINFTDFTENVCMHNREYQCRNVDYFLLEVKFSL